MDVVLSSCTARRGYEYSYRYDAAFIAWAVAGVASLSDYLCCCWLLYWYGYGNRSAVT